MKHFCRNSFLLATLLFFCHGKISAQKDTVKVGVYVTSIYALGFAENNFGMDFWIWYVYPNDSINPIETTEIVNSESVSFEYNDIDKRGNMNWATHKCKAMIKKDWKISRFPLDGQTLEVFLEETDMDTSELVYVADVANSRIDESVILSGWKIDTFSLTSLVKTYSTSYGDPELKDGKSSYARVVMTTKISRDSKNIFLKLFLGLYVAFLISLLVFFLDGQEIGARTSLAVGALFAAVGNKYIVDSSLPDHVSFTIVDKIHNVSFALIFFSILCSVISNRIARSGRNKMDEKFDRICFGVSLLTYIVAHYLIIRP
jgi:hypothetical protein